MSRKGDIFLKQTKEINRLSRAATLLVTKKKPWSTTTKPPAKGTKNVHVMPQDLRVHAFKARQEWYENLPPEFKLWKNRQTGNVMPRKISRKAQRRLRKDFMRAGVPWPWERVRLPQWDYVKALRGRKCDFSPKEVQAKLAANMKKMPELIAQYRQDCREFRFDRRKARTERMQDEKEEEAAKTSMMEVRELVAQFDASDNIWELLPGEVDPFAEQYGDEFPEAFPELNRDLEGRFADEEIRNDTRRFTEEPGFKQASAELEKELQQLEQKRLEEERRTREAAGGPIEDATKYDLTPNDDGGNPGEQNH